MKKLRMIQRQRMKKEAFLSKIILARTPLPHFQVISVFEIGQDTKLTNKSNMASFAEQLRALANPEPSRFDLDDDEFDLTRAEITNKDTIAGNLEEQKFSRGNNLRKKAVTLLQDEDKKYAGRTITRAQLEVSRDQAGRSHTDEESAEENDFQGTE